MVDEATAVVLDAPQEAVRETPTNDQTQGTSDQTSSPATDGEGTASPTAQTAAPKSDKLDIDTLLQNEAYRKELRAKMLESDPDLKREIEHRARSARKADVEREAQALYQAYVQQQEAERAQEKQEAALRAKLEADPYDLGTQHLEEVKGQLSELEKQKEGRRQQALLYEAQHAVAPQLFETLTERDFQRLVGQTADCTDEEKRELHWRNPKYITREEWIDAVADARANKKAAKLLKAKLPSEVEARVMERLGADRDQTTGVPQLPQGAGSASDSEFMARVASGGDYDKARMISKLKDWDIL